MAAFDENRTIGYLACCRNISITQPAIISYSDQATIRSAVYSKVCVAGKCTYL